MEEEKVEANLPITPDEPSTRENNENESASHEKDKLNNNGSPKATDNPEQADDDCDDDGDEDDDVPSMIIVEVEPFVYNEESDTGDDEYTIAGVNGFENGTGSDIDFNIPPPAVNEETVATSASIKPEDAVSPKEMSAPSSSSSLSHPPSNTNSAREDTINENNNGKFALEEGQEGDNSNVPAAETDLASFGAGVGIETNAGENDTSQNISSSSTLLTPSIKDPFEVSIKQEVDLSEEIITDNAGDQEDQNEWLTSKVSLNEKRHNLSIPELRRKLAFCPICQVQYSNHKLANLCLAKHGKRQCWLCLDILSSKRDDFYLHCMEHHSISSSGDIVGCPFCGKFFDFRQGLNQHIVKIHFSESISDIEAVSSLSPSTLVDIFTGKPRSTLSDEIQCQSNQTSSNIDATQNTGQVRSSDDYNPMYSGLDYSGINLPSVLPPTMPTPSEQQHHHPHHHHHDQRAYERDMQSTSSTTSRVSSSHSLNQINSGNHPSVQSSPSASLLDAKHYSRRPSVITPLNGSVQKMCVPPEQTLSSLCDELGVAGLSSPNYIQMYDQQRQSYQLSHNNGSFPEENNVEVLENSGFKLHKYVDSTGLSIYSKAVPISPSSTQTMRQTTSFQEKYDNNKEVVGFYNIDPDQELSTSIVPLPVYNKEDSNNYEQIITRVSNADSFLTPQQPQQQQQQQQEYRGGDISSMSSLGMLDPAGLNSQNQLSTLEQVTSALSEIDKDYSDIERRNQVTISEKVIHGDGASHSGTFCPSSLEQNQSNKGGSASASFIPDQTNIYKNGINFNPEIGQGSCSPKFPDNCGVKRRILMKAMWDEQQFKRPAVAQSHALVNDLHAATSLLGSTPSSCSGQTDTSADLQKVMTFNRGFSDDAYLANSILGQDHSNNQQLEQQQQQEYQQRLQAHTLSGGMVAKDAGPFFEKYVKEDSKNRSSNPMKLLELTRSNEDHSEQNVPQLDLNNTATPTWNNFYPPPPTSQISTALNNTPLIQYKSCARYDSITISSGGVSGGSASTTSVSQGASSKQAQQQANKWMMQMPPPYPNPPKVHNNNTSSSSAVRKPANPAFWDSLRARLMLAQGAKQNRRGGNPHNNNNRQEGFPIHSLNTNRRSRQENVVVQNPFDEEMGLSATGRSGNREPKGMNIPGRFLNFPRSRFGNNEGQMFPDAAMMRNNTGHSFLPPPQPPPPPPQYVAQMRAQPPHLNNRGLNFGGQPPINMPFHPPPWGLGKGDKGSMTPQQVYQRHQENQNHQQQQFMQLHQKFAVTQQNLLRNFGQPPPFLAPQYTEHYQQFLHRLHHMERNRHPK